MEHGSFTPLVFSAAGGMGTAATVTCKRLTSLLADKYVRSRCTFHIKQGLPNNCPLWVLIDFVDLVRE